MWFKWWWIQILNVRPKFWKPSDRLNLYIFYTYLKSITHLNKNVTITYNAKYRQNNLFLMPRRLGNFSHVHYFHVVSHKTAISHNNSKSCKCLSLKLKPLNGILTSLFLCELGRSHTAKVHLIQNFIRISLLIPQFSIILWVVGGWCQTSWFFKFDNKKVYNLYTLILKNMNLCKIIFLYITLFSYVRRFLILSVTHFLRSSVVFLIPL